MSDLTDPYGAGPPPGSQQSTGLQHPPPIGVPYQYDSQGNLYPWMATRYRPSVPLYGREQAPYYSVPPSFFEGDQYKPATLPPSQVAALQRALIAAGLLKATDINNWGYWDDASASAYEQVLGYANRAGISFPNPADAAAVALQQLGAAHANQPQPGLQTSVTNADDLRLAFRSAIINELGQGWDAGKIDAMIGAYQQTERDYQIRAQTAQAQGTSADLTRPPDPAAYATAQVETQDPTGVAAHNYLGFANQFLDIVGKWHQ